MWQGQPVSTRDGYIGRHANILPYSRVPVGNFFLIMNVIQDLCHSFSNLCRVLDNNNTCIFKSLYFGSASPLPPDTIAPAWPMRLPAGALTPAIKAITGFDIYCR